MTERIVVGIDGSAPANEALRWALSEARVRGADLEVVHAWEFPVVAVAQYGGVSVPVVDRDEVEKAADELVRHTLRDVVGGEAGAPVPVSVVTRPGKASEVLVEASKGAAMVVVGARGRGGFSSLLLGSVSSQVVHHATVPVVVVPADALT